MMPVMGGQECLQGLLKINQFAKVVVASGYTADRSVADTVTAGARGSINKPCTRTEALEEIRKVLDA